MTPIIDVGQEDGVLHLTLPSAFPTRTKTKAEGFSLFTTPKEIAEEPVHNQKHLAATKQSVVTDIFFGTEKIGLFLEEGSGLHRTKGSTPDKPSYSDTDEGGSPAEPSTMRTGGWCELFFERTDTLFVSTSWVYVLFLGKTTTDGKLFNCPRKLVCF